MNHTALRWALLLVVVNVPSACAIERAVVATLDSAGAAGTLNASGADHGGEVGGSSAGTGQVSTFGGGGSGGAPEQPAPNNAQAGEQLGGAPATPGSGGSSGIEGEASGRGGSDQGSLGGGVDDCLNVDRTAGGAGSTDVETTIDLMCACLGEAPILLCGTDGVTYDPLCGENCPAFTVECLHACPCDADEMEPTATIWFASDGDASTQCADGFACIGSPRSGELEPSCITVSPRN